MTHEAKVFSTLGYFFNVGINSNPKTNTHIRHWYLLGVGQGTGEW